MEGPKEEAEFKSFFELWPPILFYTPVVLYCIWLAVRLRGVMLFTASNPSIYSGGMLLESKSEILGLVSKDKRRHIAPWTVYTMPNGNREARDLREEASAALEAAGISLPIVAKPDVGQRGSGVRPVYDSEQLGDYLTDCAPGMRIILQHLIPYPEEAGVLYYRKPGESSGHIISVTVKKFPTVTGDGVRTLRELILADNRAKVTSKVFFRRHKRYLDKVVPKGEPFQLVFAGNHCQGSVFLDGTDLVTPELFETVQEIASAIPEFYFGRFDIRCRSIESLLRGKISPSWKSTARAVNPRISGTREPGCSMRTGPCFSNTGSFSKSVP